jgi:hypothetical protein
MKDIRRALEQLTPDAKWDFSIPNEGGDESQYNAITWKDSRPKPTWAEITTVADTFAAHDLQQYRESLSCGPVQLRRALRAAGHKQAIDAWIAQADPDTVEDWEYTTEIKRLDPMVLSAQAYLEATDKEVDTLFELGKTLA